MNANEKTLNTFTTRVRQMILQYQEVKKENTQLQSIIEQRDKEIQELQAKLSQAQIDYNFLKTARMIEITDSDMENAQKRIAKLIRDVNRCITILSEEYV